MPWSSGARRTTAEVVAKRPDLAPARVLLGLGAGACDQTVNLGRVVGDGGPMDMGDLGEPGDMGPLDGDTGDGGAGCETPLLADMLALGSDHLCVLRAGEVTCFGGGESGQRCDGVSGNTPLPTSPVGFDTYTAVYAGGLNTCLVRSDGMLADRKSVV